MGNSTHEYHSVVLAARNLITLDLRLKNAASSATGSLLSHRKLLVSALTQSLSKLSNPGHEPGQPLIVDGHVIQFGHDGVVTVTKPYVPTDYYADPRSLCNAVDALLYS